MTEKEILEVIKDSAIKARQLITAKDNCALSKLGGLPDVPDGFQWPEFEGRPLSFLAQIDLTKIPIWLTATAAIDTGMLYFFYDKQNQPWGYDPASKGAWQVIHLIPSSDLLPARIPERLGSENIFDEKRLEASDFISFPSLERLGLDFKECRKEFVDTLNDYLIKQRPEGTQHQLCGYPMVIQQDFMEIECQLASNGLYLGNQSGYNDPRAESLAAGAADWRLLLQIDSDDDTRMMWGDCGCLYFWIRLEDILKADFSNTWMILQCC